MTIASPVFAESEEEAAKALAVLGTCPVADKAMINVPYMPTTLGELYTAVMTNYPEGHRYIADNMFTSASAEELLPGIRKIIETMPPHPSHFIFTGWNSSPDRVDKVYGLEDEIYMGLYTVWQDPGRRRTLPRLGRVKHGGDVAFGDRHRARRREPRQAPGAVHHRTEHGAPRQGALDLRSGRPLPQLDGPEMKIAVRQRLSDRRSATRKPIPNPLRVLVAGAGVAGMSIARGLLRDGHDVTVFEQRPDMRPGGGAVTIWSNGATVLEQLGVDMEGAGQLLSTVRIATSTGRRSPLST